MATRHLADHLLSEQRIYREDQHVGPFRTPLDPKLRDLGYDFRATRESSIYNRALISVRHDHPGLFTHVPGVTLVTDDFITDIRNLSYNIAIE